MTIIQSRNDVDVDSRDNRQRTPLHLVAHEGHTDERDLIGGLLQVFMSKREVDFDARDADGKPVLDIARARPE